MTLGAACCFCLSGAAAAQDPPEEAEAPPAAAAAPAASGCVETFDVKRTWSGAAEVRLSSSCRKGGEPVALIVEGYSFSAVFDAQGQADAVVPLLGRLTLLNWRDSEGAPRAELIDFPDHQNSIQIALIWEGAADLELSLRESPGFSRDADPDAQIGPHRPNLDLASGYGRLILSDQGGAPGHHAQVYVLEAAQNPVLRGLRARARIEPWVLADLEDEARQEACRALAESRSRFHFTLHVNLYGAGRVERHALGAAACDPEAALEKRLMRMDPVDFDAER